MINSLLEFDVTINRLWPGEKLALGDRRFGVYNGSFHRERHTLRSLAAEIAAGCSFCVVLGGCELEHCGQRFCCYPDRKDDPRHCGRSVGYRSNRHFVSAQVVGVDADTGDSRSTTDYWVTDSFFQQYGGLAYTTLSDTREYRKCRAVFILEQPITDASRCRALKTGLMQRYPWTDAAVKDPSRFLYGSKPGSGQVVMVGNILPMNAVEELIAEARASARPVERQTTATRLMGDSPAHRYVQKAIASITGKLATAPPGVGERYTLVIPTALKLQGLKVAPWLPEDVRGAIDVNGLTLDACDTNGLIDLYGEDHVRKAIDWAITRADATQEPRQRPWRDHWGHLHLPRIEVEI